VALAARRDELDTAAWCRVLDEAAALGVLQVAFTGGEPLQRPDLAALIAHAVARDLAVDLATSGIGLDDRRAGTLAAAGLRHVQLSLQDATPHEADAFTGRRGVHARKRDAARAIRAAGLRLTLNVVVHRGNLGRLPAIVDLALALGADRLEVAHVQYAGWAVPNRAALLPTRAQVDAARALLAATATALHGRLRIDHVLPDLHGSRPRPCMAGWGRRFLVIDPEGHALPCHAARTLPGLRFPRVGATDLAGIWRADPAFAAFRGTGWMREPCRSCPHREEDFGGCRCQAFALTGDARAADPVCALAPGHAALAAAVARETAATPAPPWRLRGTAA
jgi:pyrroloquinoline quinone biosynthesis protein E